MLLLAAGKISQELAIEPVWDVVHLRLAFGIVLAALQGVRSRRSTVALLEFSRHVGAGGNEPTMRRNPIWIKARATAGR